MGQVSSQAPPAQEVARMAGRFVEALAQLVVAQHQRLARGALHRQAALGQGLRRGRQRNGLCRAVAALGHQGFQRKQRAQGGRAQQQANQQERDQQQLREREAG